MQRTQAQFLGPTNHQAPHNCLKLQLVPGDWFNIVFWLLQGLHMHGNVILFPFSSPIICLLPQDLVEIQCAYCTIQTQGSALRKLTQWRRKNTPLGLNLSPIYYTHNCYRTNPNQRGNEQFKDYNSCPSTTAQYFLPMWFTLQTPTYNHLQCTQKG